MVVASVGAANRKGDVAGSARTPRTSVQIDCWSAALSERMPAVANARIRVVAWAAAGTQRAACDSSGAR